jgi:hypothetical protein
MHYDCDYWIIIWTNREREREVFTLKSEQLTEDQKTDLYLSSGLFLSDIGTCIMDDSIEEALLRVNRLFSARRDGSVIRTYSTELKGTVRIVVTGVKR